MSPGEPVQARPSVSEDILLLLLSLLSFVFRLFAKMCIDCKCNTVQTVLRKQHGLSLGTGGQSLTDNLGGIGLDMWPFQCRVL